MHFLIGMLFIISFCLSGMEKSEPSLALPVSPQKSKQESQKLTPSKKRKRSLEQLPSNKEGYDTEPDKTSDFITRGSVTIRSVVNQSGVPCTFIVNLQGEFASIKLNNQQEFSDPIIWDFAKQSFGPIIFTKKGMYQLQYTSLANKIELRFTDPAGFSPFSIIKEYALNPAINIIIPPSDIPLIA